jgi:hypothetical protein
MAAKSKEGAMLSAIGETLRSSFARLSRKTMSTGRSIWFLAVCLVLGISGGEFLTAVVEFNVNKAIKHGIAVSFLCWYLKWQLQQWAKHHADSQRRSDATSPQL